MHDYEMNNIADQTKDLPKKIETTEIKNAEIVHTAAEKIVEKSDEKNQIVNPVDVENDINSESDWEKPISLKGLKKKLNEIFIVK